MTECDLCHEATSAPRQWRRLTVCESCGDHVDYHESMTRAEREAEDDAIALYVEESGKW